jgi:phosphoglycolate phosphatase
MVSFTVVFDLDGTLVDTAPDLVATLNMVFVREGLPAVPYEVARNMVGGGARAMIERGLKAEGRTLSTAEVDLLVKDFIGYYADHIADRSRLFPGVTGALDELAAADCLLAVCTNKLEWLSLRLLDALGLRDRFGAICGADTFGVQKPDPELLRRTIARASGRPDQAVMVGDSITDIATARAAGVPVIAVDFGYSESPIAELGPNRVISAYKDLPGAVFDLLGSPIQAARPIP